MSEFEYVEVRFSGKLSNGYRMSKEWNDVNEAIKELIEMSKSIVLRK